MTLAISRLNNIFSLHIRTQTIFSSFPMCENVNNLSLKKLLISMNNIILTISGRTNFLIGWKAGFSVGAIWAIFFLDMVKSESILGKCQKEFGSHLQ
jgi:hypothetical protein